MVIKLTFATLRSINIGRWILYEKLGLNVIKVVNPIEGHGWVSGNIIWQLEPPIAISTFLTRFPEAVEVIEVADVTLSNPSEVLTPNAATFKGVVTTITVAGTPQQLSSIVVPDGRQLTVSSVVTNDPKKLIFVADSSANALLPAARVELRPGNSVKLYVANADAVWVDSDLSGQKVVAVVEQ